MKIYLASNYSTHPEMREHAKTLEALGHKVTSEWINGTHGGDDRALYAQIDLRDVDAADAVIFFSESPEGSRMFEYQRATRGLRAPDLAIPETDLQIVFGVVPQEFVEETGALRRRGMALKGGTRDQVDQTHC